MKEKILTIIKVVFGSLSVMVGLPVFYQLCLVHRHFEAILDIVIVIAGALFLFLFFGKVLRFNLPQTTLAKSIFNKRRLDFAGHCLVFGTAFIIASFLFSILDIVFVSVIFGVAAFTFIMSSLYQYLKLVDQIEPSNIET